MRHEGAIEKFIGDAVMAVFGIPTVREDDAMRAVRAANEMRHALEEVNEQLELRWGVRLQARTGVNTGEVIAGDASRGEGFVSGRRCQRRRPARAGSVTRRDPDRRADAGAGPQRGVGPAGGAAGAQGQEPTRAGLLAPRRRCCRRRRGSGAQLTAGRPGARAGRAARRLRPHGEREELRAGNRRRAGRHREVAADERVRRLARRVGQGGDRPLPLLRGRPHVLAAARDRGGAGRDRGRRQRRGGPGEGRAVAAGRRRPGLGGRAGGRRARA